MMAIRLGFVEGVILLGLVTTVIATAITLSSLFVPLFTLLLVFIYFEVFQAEEVDGGAELNRLLLSAPISEVVELLDKVLAFLRGCCDAQG